MQYERTKQVDDMIARIAKEKECSEKDAINYMLGVATGRLKALGRYSDKLPDGKTNLGILVARGKKKPAEKSKPVITRVVEDASKTSKRAGKPAKAAKRKAAKRKTKAKPAESEAAVAE